jgi:hypothetical protein
MGSIRKRLKAIKYLHEGQTRQEVMAKIGCARKSLRSSGEVGEMAK